jgi:hypothetical protein
MILKTVVELFGIIVTVLTKLCELFGIVVFEL